MKSTITVIKLAQYCWFCLTVLSSCDNYEIDLGNNQYSNYDIFSWDNSNLGIIKDYISSSTTPTRSIMDLSINP